MARKTKDRTSNVLKRKRRSAAFAKRSRDARVRANDQELLAPEKLKQLYSTMLQCRMVEERAQLLYREGKLAGHHRAGTGREASTVGAILDLLPGDSVAPRRRDVVTTFGFGFTQGTPLKQVFAQLCAPGANSKPARSQPPQRGQAPLIIAGAAAMASRLNISTGVALAYKTQAKPNVVVAFSGDDSTALGSWHEAVAFAVVYKLPIVHVVQNDVWTEPPDPRLLPSMKPPDITAQGHTIPTLTVDGNDVVAVYRVAQEAIRRARQGHGPAAIECKTDLWPGLSATGGAQNSGANPGEDAKPPDPISCMEAYLKQKGLWSDAWKRRLVDSFNKQLDAAVKFAERLAVTKAISY
jgi:TPP-dependent pyruvate/acetoin dehydrogenase alpha subunit